jgi:hypothetical protein
VQETVGEEKDRAERRVREIGARRVMGRMEYVPVLIYFTADNQVFWIGISVGSNSYVKINQSIFRGLKFALFFSKWEWSSGLQKEIF